MALHLQAAIILHCSGLFWPIQCEAQPQNWEVVGNIVQMPDHSRSRYGCLPAVPVTIDHQVWHTIQNAVWQCSQLYSGRMGSERCLQGHGTWTAQLARKKISFWFIPRGHNILVEPGNGRYNPWREHSGLSSESKWYQNQSTIPSQRDSERQTISADAAYLYWHVFTSMVSVTTDGAPAMVGGRTGAVVNNRGEKLVRYHSMIHLEPLAAQKLETCHGLSCEGH